ncbi:MAG: hypothetical protein HOH95_06870 [Dehalococcoidia bacterium]|nr:hypothetical protein [Dehalococcoidia bacterium]
MHHEPPGPERLFVERVHLPFVIAGFAIALIGGFALAILVPIVAAYRGPNLSFVEHSQLHGHLQTVGFVGFFIVGVGYRLVPRFTGHQLTFQPLIAPSFYLLSAGILTRFISQPISDLGPFGAIMALSGWLELAGIACFALVVTTTASTGIRRGDPTALLFATGAIWFLVQAVLNAAWLTEAWRNQATVLAGDRTSVLALILFFGVHLSFIFAVALRSFPVFFNATRPGWGVQHAALALAQIGLIAALVAGLIDVAGDPRPRVLESTGLILLGAAFVAFPAFTGWWRAPVKLRPGSQPFALTLQAAMAWCTLAGLLLIGYSLEALLTSSAVATAPIDAVRHIVGLGVVTMTIVGMAQLILPEFAGERLRRPPAPWRGTAFAVALTAATALRAVARLFAEQLTPELSYWLMGIAGIIAFGALVMLAFFFFRALRGFPDIIKFAAITTRRLPPS